MFMRRRPLMRAAVVGGGAYVAGKSVARRSAQRERVEDDQNERNDNLEQQQAPATAKAAAPSMPDQLNRLTALHQQGALTDDEFTTAKAKLLG